MKLHLGCGLDKMKGYLNCDIDKSVNPDKIVDLEKPLVFKDNSVDKIFTKHTLEHIKNIIPLILELHRICKNGAEIHIKVPFYSSYAMHSLHHVTEFTPDTFYDSSFSGMFEVNYRIHYFIEKKNLVIDFFVGRFENFINKHSYFYCRFLANIFPSSEIEYHLRVIK